MILCRSLSIRSITTYISVMSLLAGWRISLMAIMLLCLKCYKVS